jgi:hypothetical protein
MTESGLRDVQQKRGFNEMKLFGEYAEVTQTPYFHAGKS